MRAPLLALGVLLFPAIALAQQAPTDPLHAPGFVTLDRFDGNSRVGAEISYLVYDEPDGVDITGLRFDIHGHYVDKKSGFGGYVTVPIGYASIDSALNNSSVTALGNIDIGGLWTKQVANLVGLVVRGGIVLPTLGDGDDSGAPALVTAARLTDVVQALPETTSLRFSISPIIRAGRLFARGDLGVDLTISDPDGADYDNALRFNVGAGYDGGGFAVGGELTLVSSNETATNLAIFGRFQAGPAAPYVALVFPLDSEYSQDVSLAVTAGLDIKLN